MKLSRADRKPNGCSESGILLNGHLNFLDSKVCAWWFNFFFDSIYIYCFIIHILPAVLSFFYHQLPLLPIPACQSHSQYVSMHNNTPILTWKRLKVMHTLTTFAWILQANIDNSNSSSCPPLTLSAIAVEHVNEGECCNTTWKKDAWFSLEWTMLINMDMGIFS